MVLVILGNEPKIIINIYRSFHPQDGSTPKSNFISQLLRIKEAYQKNMIILGDFNLNHLMRDDHNYDQYDMFVDFEEIIISQTNLCYSIVTWIQPPWS